MIQITEKSRCNGCHACANICPKRCIAMQSDKEGFWYPVVDTALCIDCDLCKKVCPELTVTDTASVQLQSAVASHVKSAQDARTPIASENIAKTNTVDENESKTNTSTEEISFPIVYAAYSANDAVRLESSSGGIFTLLAEAVIAQGGVVFGAAFQPDFSVAHCYAETVEALAKFRGAKYLQSKIGDSYVQAKIFLQAGRTVLFSGTPCQIGGLKSYLGMLNANLGANAYPNLLCQDIICHGVPSPKVWQEYIAFRQEQAGANLEQASFRDKGNGWKSYEMRMNFSNGEVYHRYNRNDLLSTAFGKNVSLRPSCFDCAFKGASRQADITLADFWGIQHYKPTLDDDKGTSLIVLHSVQGQQAFEALANKMTIESVELVEALKYNPSMLYSATENKNRTAFFAALGAMPFDKLVHKYCDDSLVTKVKRKVKGILKH